MNQGIPYAIGICCIWPIVVHLGITYITRYLATHDLKNIQWQNLRMPWSKDE